MSISFGPAYAIQHPVVRQKDVRRLVLPGLVMADPVILTHDPVTAVGPGARFVCITNEPSALADHGAQFRVTNRSGRWISCQLDSTGGEHSPFFIEGSAPGIELPPNRSGAFAIASNPPGSALPLPGMSLLCAHQTIDNGPKSLRSNATAKASASAEESVIAALAPSR